MPRAARVAAPPTTAQSSFRPMFATVLSSSPVLQATRMPAAVARRAPNGCGVGTSGDSPVPPSPRARRRMPARLVLAAALLLPAYAPAAAQSVRIDRGNVVYVARN